ncbi:MAG: ferritin family protein [Candidatus Krumholzibacteriota bacterium]|nr:ferritin family protein [Candidatus Krumholzibacteriota bacterium]
MSITFNADEIFEMGMDIEKNGEAYYNKAAELARNPKIKEVFNFLAGEEKKHWVIFKKLREALPPKDTTPTVVDPESQEGLYLEALVKSRLFNNEREAEAVAESVGDELAALRAALTFEKDTILFFQTMKSMTRENLGRDKIDMLIEEEHKHVIQISREIKKAKERD